MNRSIDLLTKALGVVTTDPKIRCFLEDNDPQALQQCEEALRSHFSIYEDMYTAGGLR
jgi:hypothetical protein